MNDTRYRRDVIEFIVGPPDNTKKNSGQPSDGLVWPCGCRATEQSDGLYAIEPCEEHRSEFDEAM